MKGKIVFVVKIFTIVSVAFIIGSSSMPPKAGKFVLIPAGTLSFNDKTVSVQSFYLYSTEVTNGEYREFLNTLLAESKKDDYNKAFPDTLKLQNEQHELKYYFSHPAYDNYPVVGISYNAAIMYCKWLENKIIKEEKFKGQKVIVRLPTQDEWIYAAQGLNSHNIYSWKGFSLRDEKGKICCNYFRIGDEYLHQFVPGKDSFVVMTREKDFILTKMVNGPEAVVSYRPNDYGLYNMCGNVAEMIDAEGYAVGGSFRSTGYDVRVRSIRQYELPSVEVGFRPVFTVVGD